MILTQTRFLWFLHRAKACEEGRLSVSLMNWRLESLSELWSAAHLGDRIWLLWYLGFLPDASMVIDYLEQLRVHGGEGHLEIEDSWFTEELYDRCDLTSLIEPVKSSFARRIATLLCRGTWEGVASFPRPEDIAALRVVLDDHFPWHEVEDRILEEGRGMGLWT